MSLEQKNHKNRLVKPESNPLSPETKANRDRSSRPKFLFVDAEWLSVHLVDANLRVIEIDYEPANAYFAGHIPGAYMLSWNEDLCNNNRTGILDRKTFEGHMSRFGVDHDSEIVLYGDNDNLLPIFAFWIFQYYGHDKVKILDGGRDSWTDSGRYFTKIVPTERHGSAYIARTDNIAILPDYIRASQRIEESLSGSTLEVVEQISYAE